MGTEITIILLFIIGLVLFLTMMGMLLMIVMTAVHIRLLRKMYHDLMKIK